jgi:hypothetical protein
VSLPQSREVTDAAGFRWLVTVDRGRLVLTEQGGDGAVLTLDDPADLRWLGMQAHRAAVEYDLDAQHTAAKRSADRRLARIRSGEPAGNRHRPVVEAPEPAINLDPLVRRLESA